MTQVINKVKTIIATHGQIIRYIISGGTAACVDIGFLVLFTEAFGWWYLVSAILAFILAFGVSFGLQKFWTFKDHVTDNMHVQASIYLLVSLVNLGLNTLLMYFFVDLLHMWYVFAQVLTGGLIAILSFFVYKKFIFKNSVANFHE